MQHNADIKFGGSATGGWCWIQQWQYDLLGGKVIEIFSYVFLVVVYVATWRELKRIHYRRIGGDMVSHSRSHLRANYNNGIHGSSSRNKLSPTPRTYINPNMHQVTPSSSHQHKKPSNMGLSVPNASGNSLRDNSRANDIGRVLAQQHKQEAVNRLLFIPVVFFFLRIGGTLHMIVDVIINNQGTGNETLDTIDKILGYVQALC